jgi:hypothetical protein
MAAEEGILNLLTLLRLSLIFKSAIWFFFNMAAKAAFLNLLT